MVDRTIGSLIISRFTLTMTNEFRSVSLGWVQKLSYEPSLCLCLHRMSLTWKARSLPVLATNCPCRSGSTPRCSGSWNPCVTKYATDGTNGSARKLPCPTVMSCLANRQSLVTSEQGVLGSLRDFRCNVIRIIIVRSHLSSLTGDAMLENCKLHVRAFYACMCHTVLVAIYPWKSMQNDHFV